VRWDSRFNGKLREQPLHVLVPLLNVLNRLFPREVHRLLQAERTAHTESIPEESGLVGWLVKGHEGDREGVACVCC
jgi:hypothetical protein